MDAFVLIILANAGILAFVTTFVAIGWTVEAIAKSAHRHLRSRGRTINSPDGDGPAESTRITDPSRRVTMSQPMTPASVTVRANRQSPR